MRVLLDTLKQDIGYALRTLRNAPGFAIVAICITGLAVGINSGFFTLVDSVVWRPIPVANAERLVKLMLVSATRETSVRFSRAEFVAVADRVASLDQVTAFAPGRVAVADPRGAHRAAGIGAGVVSGNYFTALGATAVRGRVISAGDDTPGAAAVAVVSERIWRATYRADPDIIGREVTINGSPVVIVGVIAREFFGVSAVVPDVWLPLGVASRIGAAGASDDTDNRFLMLHAYLRAGVTRAQASAELGGIVAEPPRAPGSVASGKRVVGAMVLPQSSLVPLDATTAKVALPGFVIVGLVLVIACANLAVLLLARAVGRQREVAIRMAIGASRGRLVRQMLTESTLIALLGAAIGFSVATVGLRMVAASIAETLPIAIGTVVLDLHPSGRVYGYAALMVVATVLAFGLLPALQGTRVDINALLKGDNRAFGTRVRRSRFRDALVTVQVAACVVLAVAATTLVRSLRDALRTETNLDVAQVHVAMLGMDQGGNDGPALAAARTELGARLARLASVHTVARATTVPFASAWGTVHVAATPGEVPRALPANTVTPAYFDVVRQRIVRGTGFTAADSAAGSPAAVVTVAAARTLWPGVDAIGQTMHVSRSIGAGRDSVLAYRVAGIVADARSGSLFANDSAGYVYLLATARQVASGSMALLVRETPGATTFQRDAALLAGQVAPAQVFETVAVTTLLDAQVIPFRYAALVASIIAAFGIAIAAIGLHAVVAYSVRQRRREVGVRVALGATPRNVLRAVLRRELQLVGAGLAVGMVLALGQSVLLRVSGIPFSAIGLNEVAIVPALLCTVAAIAAAIPARAALRVDPMEMLRHE